MKLLMILAITLLAGAEDGKVGSTFPDFSLEPLVKSEGPIALKQLLKTKKVILIDFWAHWCGPCKESFPELDTLQKEFGQKGLQVVGVNTDESAEDGLKFLNQQPVSFRMGHDPKQALTQLVGVETVPTSFLIDRKGKILIKKVGYRARDISEYRTKLKALLK